MAYQMVINSNNVVYQNNPAFQINQKLAPDLTITLTAGADNRLLGSVISLQAPLGSNFNGYSTVEVYDKDDNLVFQVDHKGKFGKDLPFANSYAMAAESIQILGGVSDSVVSSFDGGFDNVTKTVTLSPATFSTGKLVLSFSGNIPNNGILFMSAGMLVSDPSNPLIYTLGQGSHVKSGANGHISIEIPFSLAQV